MDLMAPLIAQDPGSPRITTYTAAGRMELSAVTAGNWASKVANLLVEAGLGPGDSVALEARTGWMPLVVMLGCWRAGVAVHCGEGDPPATVFTDADPAEADQRFPDAEVYLLSTDPFGRGVAESGGEVPFGMNDFSPELRIQPDAFLGAEATGAVLLTGTGGSDGAEDVDEPALRLEAGDLLARYARAGGRGVPRTVEPGWEAGAGSARAMADLLLPLVVEGSVVVVEDPSALEDVAATEHGTVLPRG